MQVLANITEREMKPMIKMDFTQWNIAIMLPFNYRTLTK